MKEKNLLLFAIISFLAVLSVFGISFAEDTISGVNIDDWTYTTSEEGTVVTLTAYNGSSTDVVIPTNGDFGENVKEVHIDYTVMKSIVKDKSATSISISSNGNKVIADGEDWSYAFSCSNPYSSKVNKSLVSLDLSHFDSSTVTNMGSMFYGCSALSSLDLSSFNTSSVANMEYMFYYCASLTSLDLSNFNTSAVTNMSYMFGDCRSLKSLDLSSFNTSAVTNMEDMFYGCKSLEIINLSSFNTSAVKNMYWMFYDCSALSSLDLSSFNTSAVTNMQDMFYDCSALSSLDLSNFNTSAVTNMQDMFSRCSALSSLNLSSFNTSAVTNMQDMFNGCSALSGLDLSNFNTSAVEHMVDMFYGCKSLKSLDLSSFDTSAVTDMGSMFSGCSALSSLDLSSFDTSAVTDMGSMFSGCSALSSLDLSSFNTSAVKSMAFMFYNCSAFNSLDLSSFNTSNVTSIASMFRGCSSLKTIIVSNLWSIGQASTSSFVFYCCGNLIGEDGTKYDDRYTDATYARIDGEGGLPGYLTSNVKRYTSVDGNWKYTVSDDKKKITLVTYRGSGGDIVLPKLEDFTETWPLADTVAISKDAMQVAGKKATTFKTANSSTSTIVYDDTDMTSIFSENTNLTDVDLTGLDISNVTNMTDMFNGCSTLKTVYVPSNWATDKVTSSTNMFYNCTSIVGQKGTTYLNTNPKNKSYARIDGGPDSDTPGYFTQSGGGIAVESVSLSAETLELKVGESSTLTATVLPENADNMRVTWSSDNETAATVDQKGLVTAIDSGTSVITVTTLDGGKTASCTVTVTKDPELEVCASMNQTALRPGWQANVIVSLQNYDAETQPIGSMLVEIPTSTGSLSVVENSQISYIADGEFATNNDTLKFTFMPDYVDNDTIPAGTEKLFSFTIQVNEQIIKDVNLTLPLTVTIGDDNESFIMDQKQITLNVPVVLTQVVKGDLNFNGRVDILDARKAKKAAMKIEELTAEELAVADLDGSGSVTVNEARKIKRAALGEITLD